MIQFVKVNYFRSRNVYVDGEKSGKTNKIIRVDEGTHEFDLGEPKNYSPPSYKKKVTGTTSIKPMELDFEITT